MCRGDFDLAFHELREIDSRGEWTLSSGYCTWLLTELQARDTGCLSWVWQQVDVYPWVFNLLTTRVFSGKLPLNIYAYIRINE